MTNKKHYVFLFIFQLLISTLIFADDTYDKGIFKELIIPVSSDNDVLVEQYHSSGDYLILWLAPEYGLRKSHQLMAENLAQHGIEVWLTDIIESLFLTYSTDSMKQIPEKYIANLITYANQKTGKKIVLMGDSYAAIKVLEGAYHWQDNRQKTIQKNSQKNENQNYFIGAILFSPSLYAGIPSLGLAPEFMPITAATNIPLMIYQGQKSGNLTQYQLLLEQLQQHGNPVYSKIMPHLRSLFYTQKPTQTMLKTIPKISSNIKNMLALLAKSKIPNEVIPLTQKQISHRGIDRFIKEFKGDKNPLPIKLFDAYGHLYNENNYNGKVTVINFWATWCPPCVEEIPSLNRLKQKMSGLPFELISINYAEDKQTIINFMKKVNVEFPVLLDEEGDFAKKWKVITYPSTFVIAADGKIKYGVNAAIEWDDPELIYKIKQLF